MAVSTARRVLFAVAAALLGCCALALVGWRLVARRHAPERSSVLVAVSAANDAETNETAVLAPVEAAVAGVAHVASLEGHATSSGATLLVTFDAAGDDFDDVSDVQRAVSGMLTKLPPNALAPTVVRGGATEGPRFVVTGAGAPLEVRAVLDEKLASALEMLPGVARVSSCGGRDAAIVVEVDGDRLAATGLDANAVADAVRAGLGGARSLADLRDVRLGVARLSDVATLSDDGRPPWCLAFGEDGPRVVGSVDWQPGVRPDDESLKKEIAKQQALLSPGARIEPFDFGAARVRAFVQLEGDLDAGALARTAQAIAKAARAAGVVDVLVTSPREPRAGVDLEVEATLAARAGRPKIADARRAVARAIAQVPGTTVVTATDDDRPLVLRVVGAELDALRRAASSVRDALGKTPAVRGVLVLDARPRDEIATQLDRARAADLGVSARDAARALDLATRGEEVGRLRDGARATPVWVHVTEPLERIDLRHGGAVVPLSAVAHVERRIVPEAIAHWNRERAVTLWVEGDRRAAKAAVTRGAVLPAGVRLVWDE